MQPGDKIIYFKSYNFEPAPARVGHIERMTELDAAVRTEVGGVVLVPYRHVHPYTDILWSAWLQWLQNAKQLADQHRQLMAGKAPEELTQLNIFNLF